MLYKERVFYIYLNTFIKNKQYSPKSPLRGLIGPSFSTRFSSDSNGGLRSNRPSTGLSADRQAQDGLATARCRTAVETDFAGAVALHLRAAAAAADGAGEALLLREFKLAGSL